MKTVNKKLITTTAVVAILTMGLGASSCSSKQEPVPITVAWSPFESGALFYVAADEGFFTQNGLAVTEKKYDSGAAALAGVIAGEADIAVATAEFPMVNQALAGAQFKSIAVIARSEFIYIIARKDRGITKPSDLKGKRIGTTIGTIAEFHLGRYLELNGLSIKDVTIVDLKTPDEWVNAVIRGDVDAVCTAQPSADAAKKGLGDNAVFWSAQSSQALLAQAIANDTWINENPVLAERFLRALKQAEEFILNHKTQAQAIIMNRLQLDPSYMDTVWAQNRYVLSLDESLITAMEDETRWLIANNLTTAKVTPDYLNFIYEDALKKVEPDAVRIIR